MSDADPAANGNGDEPSKASVTARVLFGLFIIWASFYLVAIAEQISDNGARKNRPAPGAGQTSRPKSDPIESRQPSASATAPAVEERQP